MGQGAGLDGNERALLYALLFSSRAAPQRPCGRCSSSKMDHSVLSHRRRFHADYPPCISYSPSPPVADLACHTPSPRYCTVSIDIHATSGDGLALVARTSATTPHAEPRRRSDARVVARRHHAEGQCGAGRPPPHRRRHPQPPVARRSSPPPASAPLPTAGPLAQSRLSGTRRERERPGRRGERGV